MGFNKKIIFPNDLGACPRSVLELVPSPHPPRSVLGPNAAQMGRTGLRDARSRDMTRGPGAKRAKSASHGERVRYHGRDETRITPRRAYCSTF